MLQVTFPFVYVLVYCKLYIKVNLVDIGYTLRAPLDSTETTSRTSAASSTSLSVNISEQDLRNRGTKPTN